MTPAPLNLDWTTVFISAGRAVVLFGILMTFPPVLIYLERKVCAYIQDRRGPNRVGPFGLLQPIADAVKLLFKEDLCPAEADRWLFRLAPALAFVPPLIAFAVIPWGNKVEVAGRTVHLQVADLGVGVLFSITVTSLSVYGLAFGGWASHNKWALLGAVRSSAQMVSYEVALALALLAVLMTAGSVSLRDVVAGQTASLVGPIPAWNVFCQPVAFVVFLVAAFAENNRLPFDLPEAEPELVAGYHTEYSGMRFATFFMGEYLAMVTMSGLIVTLFLGGWHLPGMDPAASGWGAAALSVAVFLAKTSAVLFFYIWVRWTLPRFRYDQLMGLGWKALVPISLANIAVTAVVGVIR